MKLFELAVMGSHLCSFEKGNWIQRYKLTKILQRRCKLSEFVIDETLIKVGSDYVWLWVAIEPTEKTILGIRLSIERNMLVLYIILT